MSKYTIKINEKAVAAITADSAEDAARAYSEECGPDSDLGFVRGVKLVDADTRGREWAILKTDGEDITAERMQYMTIYTACNIKPADSGFGMWQRGEKQTGRETSYADLYDLVMAGSLTDLDDALANEDFIAAGIEDIRGRIENEPDRIYVVLGEECDGSPCVHYCGVEEDEVPEDFFE